MTEDEQRYLTTHQAHDFEALRNRWSALVQPCSLVEHTLSDESGYPVLAYQSRAFAESPAGNDEAIYLCAGVHGDEPAGVWGLLEWAEANPGLLQNKACLILPCFNPWGLINNRRSDADGRDLNRLFHRADLPLISAWRKVVGDARFGLALHLHEDYDARGLYLYELTDPEWQLGEAGLRGAESAIPRDPRDEIEGLPFQRGILRRSGDLSRVVEDELDGGYPEAIYVFQHHARAALTFETPSEYSLWDRVRAQRQFLDAVVGAMAR
ncbi:MAG: M14 family metallocarboxypeptidase [Verrucomicrobiae bacterium]|nr:M14 family metallocarboxypeptidase [Verrucomicrobiae bacterium]